MRQTALITGGSRGIGRAIAVRLAEAGFDIAITYLGSKERAGQVVEECESHGVKAGAFQADISSEKSCETMAAEVKGLLGPVHVLVNNAGVTQDGLAMRMKTAQFTEVIDANLTGTFVLCRLFLPDMVKARSGRIINITSVAGLHGNAGQVNYSASKAGVIGLTKSLAKEVGSRNITVNAIAPGFIETDMTSGLPDKVKQAALDKITLRRFGRPEDVSELAAFLAMPASSYITGQVIEISGGLVL